MSYYGASNRMTRIMLQKIENDQWLRNLDRSEWYKIAKLDELPQRSSFLQLTEDQETKLFLDQSLQKSDWFFTQLFHSMMLTMLKWFMTTTSINGLLNRGSMFVFSMQQFAQLIDFEHVNGGAKLGSLLDLGAGDGAVTEKMAPFFNDVYATEMSPTMRWRLSQKGYKVVDVETWDSILTHSESNDFVKFDAVSCLNLLDRCDTPISLLKRIKKSLKPNGILVVALVLPFKPYVEYNADNRPKEDLFDVDALRNETCENTCSDPNRSKNVLKKTNQQIDFLIENVFKRLGFNLEKFAKLPYLCEGNLAQSYYFMIDYVFVFKSVRE